ncbi:DUF2007 domain-containing protein [Rufibacter immobilis]|uniref:DUF2007 domain-containing protein n=1 Tax=Rufibacter immobilis TaxID=1348778 RepID=A0A3M9N2I0_9BACT|nr:DUF2007 domain-containing protein [Rufibacter immobilis]RNI32009.1 DUF2007 domain-containing protein [Rufibacter immobilis]
MSPKFTTETSNGKDTLVLLSTYSSPIDAHLAKNKLESEGILSFLFDENLVSINPLFNITVGGIKLKVLESDAPKAWEVLQRMQAQPYTNEENQPVHCPRCGATAVTYSHDSDKKVKSFLGFVLAFLTFSLPLLSKDKYKCERCGKEFRRE